MAKQEKDPGILPLIIGIGVGIFLTFYFCGDRINNLLFSISSQCEEIGDRLVCRKYSFSIAKLPEGWEPNPPPANAIMFFGNEGVHIGVFVFENLPESKSLFLLEQLTRSTEKEKRAVYMQPSLQAFGSTSGYTSITTVEFNNSGINVLALEKFVVLSANNNAYVFTFKRRLETNDALLLLNESLDTTLPLIHDEMLVFDNFVGSFRLEPRAVENP